MEIIRIPCKYNANKVYLVKVYADGHRYINQEVSGRLLNKRWIKASKRYVEEFLIKQ